MSGQNRHSQTGTENKKGNGTAVEVVIVILLIVPFGDEPGGNGVVVTVCQTITDTLGWLGALRCGRRYVVHGRVEFEVSPLMLPPRYMYLRFMLLP